MESTSRQVLASILQVFYALLASAVAGDGAKRFVGQHFHDPSLEKYEELRSWTYASVPPANRPEMLPLLTAKVKRGSAIPNTDPVRKTLKQRLDELKNQRLLGEYLAGALEAAYNYLSGQAPVNANDVDATAAEPEPSTRDRQKEIDAENERQKPKNAADFRKKVRSGVRSVNPKAGPPQQAPLPGEEEDGSHRVGGDSIFADFPDGIPLQ
jgi:hypothetical protein